MAYASGNPPSKKALKEAVARGDKVAVFSPGPFPLSHPGKHTIEGPHYPQPHRFYATVLTDANGHIVPGSIK